MLNAEGLVGSGTATKTGLDSVSRAVLGFLNVNFLVTAVPAGVEPKSNGVVMPGCVPVVVVLYSTLPFSSNTCSSGLEGGGGKTVAVTGKVKVLLATPLSLLTNWTVPV